MFIRGADGETRHVYPPRPRSGRGYQRGIDLFTWVCNLFGLLSGGRGSWLPKLSYG